MGLLYRRERLCPRAFLAGSPLDSEQLFLCSKFCDVTEQLGVLQNDAIVLFRAFYEKREGVCFVVFSSEVFQPLVAMSAWATFCLVPRNRIVHIFVQKDQRKKKSRAKRFSFSLLHPCCANSENTHFVHFNFFVSLV